MSAITAVIKAIARLVHAIVGPLRGGGQGEEQKVKPKRGGGQGEEQ